MSRARTIPGQLAFDDPALTRTVDTNPPAPEPVAPEPVAPGPVAPDPVGGPEPVAPDPVNGHGADGSPGAEQLVGRGLGRRPFEVEVIRSANRRKTAQARLIGSKIQIRIPSRSSSAEERELIEHFTAKFERQRSTDAVDLDRRAAVLADRYRLPRPSSIRWVTNQQHRWGSCTPADGSIRLSDRLADYPTWVLDYVIVHELAHLVELGHTPAFWALVDPYPLGERAKGFLIAKGHDGD